MPSVPGFFARWSLLTSLVACAAVGGCPRTEGSTDLNPSADAGRPASPADAGSKPDLGGDAGTPDSGLVDDTWDSDLPAPPVPDYPAIVGNVTLQVRTGDGEYDGADDNNIEVCLSDTRCFYLDTPDVNDWRVGEFDVYHFEDVGLARADVDQVTIRSKNAAGDGPGTDDWRPACLQVQLDGEPVYCKQVGETFGDDPGSLSTWTDPDGLHTECATCYAAPLTHGPLVGAAEPDRARVLVRTDATRKVGLRIGTRPDLADGLVRAWAYPPASRDFTAVLEPTGLESARTYHYRVEVDEEPMGPIRSFTTPPLSGAAGKMSFAFGSCSYYLEQPIWDRILDAAPDVFLFVGDNHYGDTPERDAQRWHYRNHMAVPPRASFLAQVPSIAVWDDHDFTGNNTDGTSAGKESALRVFKEYWANPSYGTDNIPGVFFKYSWGDVDFFMLDVRYHRVPVDCGDDCAEGLLGSAQTQWLLDAIESSDATFKLLVSGSPWTEHIVYPNPGDTDTWSAHMAARDALLEGLHERGVEGVLLLSGDWHQSQFRLVPSPAAGGYSLPELMSSGLSNSPWQGACEGPDLIACLKSDDYFIDVAIDSTLADPALVARIVDGAGATQATWNIKRSELALP